MLKRLYNSSITATTGRTVNAYGEYTGGITSTVYGSLKYKQKNILKPDGQTVISNAVFNTETALNVNDLITLDSVNYQILMINTIRNPFNGGKVDHYEVYF